MFNRLCFGGETIKLNTASGNVRVASSPVGTIDLMLHLGQTTSVLSQFAVIFFLLKFVLFLFSEMFKT